ncbi:MAG TPA: enoyl-CoA hydratase/isomerase family protein [Gammaproteobacteria bacterium]|nr:enoyl-CoA hydratase/isomerase family protein [Gammaproteobacteria bacterium]
MQDEILFNTKNGMGIITLNRPSALNALNAEMLTALHQQLLLWEKDNAILSVLIESSSPRVFCAGGDIKAVYYAHQKKQKNISHYFKVEYDLNHYIHNYKKPYIALLNGLTMGGGAGVSLHGRFRIATEHFVFAMPETGIGFFPDVGTSYILSRLPKEIGVYLGLTGTRINATEAHYVGLIDIDCTNGTQENHLKDSQQLIEKNFKFDTISAIFDSLSQDQHPWAQHTLAVLKQKSPTSLSKTLEMLRNAKNVSFEACIKAEYELACYFVESHDFYEGIRAAIIDKDKKPIWKPDTL